MGRITQGAAIGAVAGALSLWTASLSYACLAVVWVCCTAPRPGERALGVFLFCFAFLGLFLGSILGVVSGALGGALGGWVVGRAAKPRWRTVAVLMGFGNLVFVTFIFVGVDLLMGTPPIPVPPLVRALNLATPLAAIVGLGLVPAAIGYATARSRLRRAEVAEASGRPPCRPAS